MTDPYRGEIRMFSFGFAPRNWATCDGEVLPISQNQALFSLFGTTYGGDGTTTFALPDLRDRVAFHGDQQSFRIGKTGGAAAVALTMREMPGTHAHDPLGSVIAADTNLPKGKVLATVGVNAYASPNPLQPIVPSTIGSTGGTPHQNMAPYTVVNFCIALVGAHPSAAEA